jgi:hypothetical protein
MMYLFVFLFAFLLGSGIFYSAYKFGKYAIEGELLTLEGQNQFLRDQVDFLRADNDHLHKLVERRVAGAHENVEVLNATAHVKQALGGKIHWMGLNEPSHMATIGLCFHGVSLSEHCGQCAAQNFVAGGIVN